MKKIKEVDHLANIVKIRSLLKKKKLTIKEFGKKIDVAPGYLSQVFNRTRNCSLKLLKRIAHGLDVDIGVIINIDNLGQTAADPNIIDLKQKRENLIKKLLEQYIKGGGVLSTFLIENLEDNQVKVTIIL